MALLPPEVSIVSGCSSMFSMLRMTMRFQKPLKSGFPSASARRVEGLQLLERAPMERRGLFGAAGDLSGTDASALTGAWRRRRERRLLAGRGLLKDEDEGECERGGRE